MKNQSGVGYPVTECDHERQHPQGADSGRSTLLSPRGHQSCSAKWTFVEPFGTAKADRLTQSQLPVRFQRDQTKGLCATYITGVCAAICLMLLWWLVVPGCVVKSDEALCPGLNVSIHSLEKEDAESGCKGAADAVGFLASLGLDTTAPVSVRILDRLPDGIVAGSRNSDPLRSGNSAHSGVSAPGPTIVADSLCDEGQDAGHAQASRDSGPAASGTQRVGSGEPGRRVAKKRGSGGD